MTAYALVELVVVAALVGACGFALALRVLPTAWLKSPLGTWLDRDGRPASLRRIGSKWRGASRTGCANGCCPTGDGCAIGRAVESRIAASPSRRIPVTLV